MSSIVAAADVDATTTATATNSKPTRPPPSSLLSDCNTAAAAQGRAADSVRFWLEPKVKKCTQHNAYACARTCTYVHLGPWQSTIIAVAPQPALPAQASPRTTTYASYYLRSMHQASSLEEKQGKEVNNNPGDPRAGHRRPKPHSDPPRSTTWRRFHI